jgi:hypothetical protein
MRNLMPPNIHLCDARMTMAMILMCNEIDMLRGVLPREPVQVASLPSRRITPFLKPDKAPAPDNNWEAKYPCFNADQGRESLMKAMRQRDNGRITEMEYERIERRIRTALREQFGMNDEAVVDLCRLARTMESE